MSPKYIAKLMPAYQFSPDEQIRQTEFRCRLVDIWNILPGQRVLEIGCGQGDMTAALAAKVGPTGHVFAIDPARESYGSPVSLGDSAAALVRTELGGSMTFQYGYSNLDWIDQEFDAVVLANCSWYFSDTPQLHRTLARACELAPRLCFSEWELYPTRLDQLGHFLAVQYAKLAKLHYADAELNIRNALSRAEILDCAREAGWKITSEHTLDELELADGQWEIQMCLGAAEAIGADAKLQSIVEAVRAHQNYSQALPIFAFTAEGA